MRTRHPSCLLALSLLLGCGGDRLAGGSSSTGNSLTARVIHHDGSIAQGDSVILRSEKPDSVNLPAAVARCDADGIARFANVPSGHWSLEARGTDQGRFVHLDLWGDIDDFELSSDRYAVISGKVRMPDSVTGGKTILVGTGISALVDGSGNFRLERVSPGNHEIAARPRPDGSLGVARWESVEIAPQETKVLPITTPVRTKTKDWTLRWNEDFETLDPSRWSLDTGDGCPDLCQWGKRALQRFSTDNVSLRNGALVLQARNNAQGWTSGQIQTRGKFQFRYGRIEIDARLPGKPGAWSLLSLQGDSAGRVWPKAGAMDIAGLWGNRPDSLMAIAHFKDPSNQEHHPGTDFVTKESWSDRRVTYAIEWSPQEILWLADEQVFFRIPSNSSFEHSFYLSLGLTVGGDGNVPPSDTTSFEMVIEQIRLFQKSD